jgi:hypothetical protein
MKTTPKIGVALLLLAFAVSCKESYEGKAESSESSATEDTIIAGNAAATPATPATPKNQTQRKFIRTADIKFKVKDVAKSTYAIENTVNQFGGFVTNTSLQSNISEKNETQVSPDSTLETTRFTVENNMTIRIPNRQLDTVVKTIAKQIDYLDYRVIKADDVALKMLGNQLAQKRSDNHEKRLENDIDSKGKKLNQIVEAENGLLAQKEQSDNAKIENLSLEDQVNYSTVTLALYQREMVTQTLVANEKSINAYRPHIGLQVWDSLKTGWFILESIIAFVARLWSLILIAILGVFLFRKYMRKQKTATM